MTVSRYQPAGPLCQIVVNGPTAYLAGQVAPGESVVEQMTGILARIDELLGTVGSHRSRLLSATIWLSDLAAYEEMNRVWMAWIDPDNAPARATVEARLTDPACLVEVMATAAV